MSGVGGLIGQLNSGTLSNSYSLGDIEGTFNYGSVCSVGGIIGYNMGNVINSYTRSKIISNGNGLVGYGEINSTNKCYWCPALAGVNSNAAGTSLTLEEMKNQESYEGWDFESGTVWSMKEFPELIFDFETEE